MKPICFILQIAGLFSLSARPARALLDNEKPVQDCSIVESQNGRIVGHAAPGVPNVLEFLGIPYAEPPVGDHRFAAPMKYARHKTYKAAQWGASCPYTSSTPDDYPGLTQQSSRVFSAIVPNNTQNEDCLTLNIWTPKRKDRYEMFKPVLVFLVGGRFFATSVNSTLYNGKYFAEAENVIIVTLNYRLNIFGFPGIPNQPQNLGLRDQRLAIEWIHDNIAGFGGDPRKITLFGQSAGGVSINWYTYKYQTDPIIHGAISESGNAFSFPTNNETIIRKNWYNVSSQLGCGSSGDVISCMRNKPWQDIKAAASRLRPAPGGNVVRPTPPFYPGVDNETVFADYAARSKLGKFAKVPYLMGNNDNEGGWYRVTAYSNGINATDSQVQALTLESFTCPNSLEARNRAAAGVPTWQYCYFGDWENTRLYRDSGAYHASELFVLFGTAANVSGLPSSPEQQQMTKLMQRAWAAFARSPSTGLKQELGWPTIQSNTRSLVRLAYNNQPKADYVRPELYDDQCLTINKDLFPE